MTNTRKKSWATAAARRWKDPVVLGLPDGEGGEAEVRVRGDLDGFAVMSALTNTSTAWGQLKGLARPDMKLDETTDEILAEMTGALDAMRRTQEMVRGYIREFLVDDDRPKFDDVAAGINLNLGFEILIWIRDELSPVDPTRPTSSVDGSSEPGAPLTVTATSAELMPPPSPSTD